MRTFVLAAIIMLFAVPVHADRCYVVGNIGNCIAGNDIWTTKSFSDAAEALNFVALHQTQVEDPTWGDGPHNVVLITQKDAVHRYVVMYREFGDYYTIEEDLWETRIFDLPYDAFQFYNSFSPVSGLYRLLVTLPDGKIAVTWTGGAPDEEAGCTNSLACYK